MRCHDTVDSAVFKSRENIGGFLLGTEPGQNCHTNSVMGQTFLERFHMFVCENDQRRNEYGLFSVQKCAIDSVHGHFGFTKSHISGEEPVHGIARFHIREYLRDGSPLIGGMLIGEIFLKKRFLFGETGKRKAYGDASFRIGFQ